MIEPNHLTQGVLSPFLPGTNIQFAWDSTSIGYFKTCPRLYQYTMIEGWTGKTESIHLTFGAEYHAALEDYARLRANGVLPAEAMNKVIHTLLIQTKDWDFDTSTKTGKYKNRDTLISLVIDYLDHYIDDPCETYIRSNGSPAVELSFRFELDWGPAADTNQPYILCGHLDRVVNFNDHLFVMDHKTTTTTPGDYYFNQFEPNNQMSLYTLAGQIVLHSPIRGVIIRAAQIMLEKPHRFVQGFTYRTPDQIDEWLLDLQILFNNAEACAVAGYWPMNDTACDKFGGCRFREVCSKSPDVRESFLKASFIKLAPEDRWNPLRSR